MMSPSMVVHDCNLSCACTRFLQTRITWESCLYGIAQSLQYYSNISKENMFKPIRRATKFFYKMYLALTKINKNSKKKEMFVKPVPPSTYKCIYLFIYLFIYLLTNVFIYLFICLFIYLQMYLSVYLFAYLSTYKCINLFIFHITWHGNITIPFHLDDASLGGRISFCNCHYRILAEHH